MTFLTILLIIKIVFTALTVSIPLLFFPKDKVISILGIGPEAVPICRLWGIAVTALLVGYASGIAPAQSGDFPTGAVVMGIVSNAGATITMLVTGFWRQAKASTAIIASLALGLVTSLALPSFALRTFI